MNAYAQEDPIEVLRVAGYTDLIETRLGAAAYSYAFDGQWGYLDQALAAPSLVSQVVDLVEWHINSDEPNVLDYNTDFKSAAQVAGLFAADAYRASDHDPVIVGLNLLPAAATPAPAGSAWHASALLLTLAALALCSLRRGRERPALTSRHELCTVSVWQH